MNKRQPQPLLKDADFQLAVFRILFLIFGATYLGLGRHWGHFEISQSGYLYYVGSFSFYALLMTASIVRWRYINWRRYLAVVFDISYVTYGMIFSGGAASPLFVLYIWVILAQALRKDRGLIHLAQFLALTQYLFVIYLDQSMGRQILQSSFVVLTLIFLPWNMNIFFQIMLRARQAADQANRAKSRFLANMSHELRTPLNAIIGYSEILAENAEARKDHKDEEDLSRIRDSGYYLLDLINEILDISKIEAGKMEIHPERFELQEFVDEIAKTVSPIMLVNNNSLEIRCDAGSNKLYTDKKKLRQVLLNLLSNASKFTNSGTITLSARLDREKERDIVDLAVTDTGVGIQQERLEHLFEPFAYAEATDDSKLGSTGLGLAISKRFCEMLGGKIIAHSEPGKGSEFRVRLPVELTPA